MNKILAKLCCCFILNKEKRHKFRQKYIERCENHWTKWTVDGLNKGIDAYCENYKNSATSYLIYSSVLLESGDLDKAKAILDEYLKKYNDIDYISKFLPLANFANSIGITNKKVEDSVFMFKTFKKYEEDRLFENFITNITIAIVGNGPSEIGKNKGEEIDDKDVVIRFNNFSVNGFEKDYGSKTNIWVYCNANNVSLRPLDGVNRLKMIVFEGDIYHTVIEDNVKVNLLYYMKNNIPVVFLNKYSHDLIRNRSGIEFPSTGLILFYYIYNLFNSNKDKISLYGFSFLQEEVIESCPHYFKDDNKEYTVGWHSYTSESSFFKDIYQE